MNVSYRWLRDMVPSLSLSARELADLLAGLGAPVDEILSLAEGLGDVRIARVIASGPHPNADRLSLCQVDAGTGETLSVVCGAPNVHAGGIYPFAPVGAALPGGVRIRKAKIRGEFSVGMLCSERELGLGRDHAGIMELYGEFRPGESFVEAVGLDDARLVVDVTPNRPDLLSHVGVAREVGAALSVEPTLAPWPGDAEPLWPGLELVSDEREARAPAVTVGIEAPDLCRRYLGAVVRDVHVAPSPEWLRSRLRAVGLRPINNVVDATNYVLYELGQPLHAFDLDRVEECRIRVRRAEARERIVTLDGETRTLGRDMLVIADATRPLAVAGVMGGRDSEVSGETQTVLLECALFDTAGTRATRRALGLSTDASYRFERGVDPEGMERALARALALIVATAGGRVEARVADCDPAQWAAPVVALRPRRVAHLLGAQLEEAEIVDSLTSLGFRETGRRDAAIEFRVPGHRSYDVSREVDLIEEVARRHGYERFPDTLRPFRSSAVPDDALARLEDRLRAWLVGRGLLEAHGGGLTSAAEGDVEVPNPLSSAEDHLRRALLPGLLRRVEHNFAHGVGDIRLFEIGTGFAPSGGRGRGSERGDGDEHGEAALPVETRRLAAVLTGARRPPHWTGPAGTFDLWDVKDLLEVAGRELGGGPFTVSPAGGEPGLPAILDPRASFVLRPAQADRIVGVAGAVRADAVDAPRWAAPSFGLEIVLDPGMAAPVARRYSPLPQQPATDRDLALTVPDAIAASDVEALITESAGPMLESVRPFDVYRGEGVEPGHRSIAYRLRFRALERTLTDEEVDHSVDRVLARLEEELHVQRRT